MQHVIRFCFSLLLTSQRTLLLLDKETLAIIPEPPGLELPGFSDFLPPRSVETEARVVQRGVTPNAGSLRPRYKEMKDMRLFEDIVSELSDQARLSFSVGTQGRGEGK